MQMGIEALLENSGYFRRGRPDWNKIAKSSTSEIMEFCDTFCQLTYRGNIKPARSIYAHAASTALGGGRKPCRELDCRSDRMNELIQFACLYSDKVYINNFFWDLLAKEKHGTQADILEDFVNDITLLSQIWPLICSGKIVPVTFRPLCPHCLALEALKNSKNTDFDKATQELEERYYKGIRYSILSNSAGFAIRAVGPELLIPHGSQLILWNQDEVVQKIPSIARKMKLDREVAISIEQAKKLGVGAALAEYTIESAGFELGATRFLGASYLTDNELEIDFIRDLSSDPVAKRRSTLMKKYLTCIVPFIESVDPTELENLRKAEEEAFILFRSAITKAVEEYKSPGQNFTERDALAIYGDIIAPKLALLDSKVKSSKRHFISGGVRKVLGWTGAISVGLYTTFHTADFLAGAATFGITKAAAEFLEDLMIKSETEEAIRDDEFYFLWRVKRLAQQ